MEALKKVHYQLDFGIPESYSYHSFKSDLFNKAGNELVISFHSGHTLKIKVRLDSDLNTANLHHYVPDMFIFDEITKDLFIRIYTRNISEISKLLNKSRGYVRQRFKDMDWTLSDILLIKKNILP